ncbi:MAG: hypothetical protein DHS20C02_10800 [Micavibrio sp.]|nr:MAG: hypothetical protein DHS20C02_10800 [Micavibrio sp.]
MATKLPKPKRKLTKKTPYSKASDEEKITRNWRKSLGLFERGEYSVAILRCATCVELTVNFAIRQELVTERSLPLLFVDHLLKDSNGLHNKYHRIYLPIMAEYDEYAMLKALWKTHIEPINRQRNGVAHSGEFRTKATAKKVMADTRAALIEILHLYDLGDDLKRFKE